MLLYESLNIYQKVWGGTVNHSTGKYVNKIENIISFQIKAGFYLKHLTPELKKLLGVTKSKITKDENSEDVPHLEIIEVVLFTYNIISDNHQQNSRALF